MFFDLAAKTMIGKDGHPLGEPKLTYMELIDKHERHIYMLFAYCKRLHEAIDGMQKRISDLEKENKE